MPLTQERNRSSAFTPEIRLDLELSHDPGRTQTLSLGMALPTTRQTIQNELFEPGLVLTGTGRAEGRIRSQLAYVQLARRMSEKLSYSAQLRRLTVHRHLRGNGLLTDSSGLLTFPFEITGPPSASYWLPSFLATYLPGKNTLLRVSASRRFTDVSASVFAPTETLLLTEKSVLPQALSETTAVVEVDVERYLRPAGLVKLFLFGATSRNATYDISTVSNQPGLLMDKIRRRGVGVRLERQLGNHLFGHGSLTLTRSRATRPSASYDLAQAPYQPKTLAEVGVNYVDGASTKLGIGLRHTGQFFC